ncbi:MAG TPA: hypothetical protein VL175_02370 [Pirellulales bacterium]|jgi:hypothetical protein|nr:hypothetical protein [Pirellulales bacterium]
MKSRIIGAAAALLLLGICLSLVGNWWISDHESDGIRRDIQKVREYEQPSVAAVFVTLFSCLPENPVYKVLMDQAAACKTTTFADIDAWSSNLRLRHLDSYSVPEGALSGFSLLEFHLFAWPNKLAENNFTDLRIGDVAHQGR